MARARRRRVGVDVGSTHVRVAEVTGMTPSGKVIVSRLAASPLRPGAMVAGEIRDPSAVASAIDRAIGLASVPRHGFIIGLSGPRTGVARVDQQAALSVAERISASRYQSLPLPAGLDPATSALAVSVMRQKTTAERTLQSEVVFAAADPTALTTLTKVCALAKLTPRAVDLTAAGITRAYTRLSDADQSSALIVDIGHTAITVIARYGPSLVFIDTIPNLAGNFLTHTIQQVLECSYEEATARKHSLRLVDPVASWSESYQDRYGTGDSPLAYRQNQEELTSRDLSDAADQMIDQLSNSISTATSYLPSGSAQTVMLTGGTSRLIGLPERIEATIGIPTRPVLPWAEIEAHKRNLEYFINRTPTPDNQDPGVVTGFAAAIGLAQWRDMS